MIKILASAIIVGVIHIPINTFEHERGQLATFTYLEVINTYFVTVPHIISDAVVDSSLHSYKTKCHYIVILARLGGHCTSKGRVSQFKVIQLH